MLPIASGNESEEHVMWHSLDGAVPLFTLGSSRPKHPPNFEIVSTLQRRQSFEGPTSTASKPCEKPYPGNTSDHLFRSIGSQTARFVGNCRHSDSMVSLVSAFLLPHPSSTGSPAYGQTAVLLTGFRVRLSIGSLLSTLGFNPPMFPSWTW